MPLATIYRCYSTAHVSLHLTFPAEGLPSFLGFSNRSLHWSEQLGIPGTMSSLSRELVFLILQFLDEEKFKDTVHKLEQESGFFFNIKHFELKKLIEANPTSRDKLVFPPFKASRLWTLIDQSFARTQGPTRISTLFLRITRVPLLMEHDLLPLATTPLLDPFLKLGHFLLWVCTTPSNQLCLRQQVQSLDGCQGLILHYLMELLLLKDPLVLCSPKMLLF